MRQQQMANGGQQAAPQAQYQQPAADQDDPYGSNILGG